MKRIVIFGNSGSGKSTLAQYLSTTHNLAHLDLDTLAWQDTQPPSRNPIEQSKSLMNDFIANNPTWVIEGCYSDLIELTLDQCNEMYFMNLSVEDCIENAKKRPWEPHKYASKAAQDANLTMLLDWIKQYEQREDTFSLSAHKALFNHFRGCKHLYEHNPTFKNDIAQITSDDA